MAATPCLHCTPTASGSQLVSNCAECGVATVAGFGFNFATAMLALGVFLGVVTIRRVLRERGGSLLASSRAALFARN